MSEKVERFSLKVLPFFLTGVEMVRAADYDALKAENDRLAAAYVSAVQGRKDFRNSYRRLRDAIHEAQRHLAKSRSTWNGPVHQCNAVLEAALKPKEANDGEA